MFISLFFFLIELRATVFKNHFSYLKMDFSGNSYNNIMAVSLKENSNIR